MQAGSETLGGNTTTLMVQAQLEGGAGDVLALAASPDGARLAAGGRDRTARLWALPASEPALTLSAHRAPVTGVAFSPDGTHLATASGDLTVRLWSAADGAPGAVLEGHAGALEAVAWSAQGVVAAAWNMWSFGHITLWDAAAAEQVATLRAEHGQLAFDVAFSPDGGRIAAALAGGVVALWDTAGQRLDTLRAHGEAVRAVAWSPGGGRLLTASSDGTAKLWALGKGGAPLTLKAGGPVFGAAFSPDGTRVVTASAAGLAEWAADSGARLATLDGAARAVVWSAAGWIAAAQGREVVVLGVGM